MLLSDEQRVVVLNATDRNYPSENDHVIGKDIGQGETAPLGLQRRNHVDREEVSKFPPTL